MELNKRQTEFWAVILIICLVVSAAIMLVDFQIKQAILEESTRLRLAIEEWEVRTSGLRAYKAGATSDTPNNRTFSGPVLVDDTARMETGNVPNGGTTKASKAPRSRRHDPQRPSDSGEIPPGA